MVDTSHRCSLPTENKNATDDPSADRIARRNHSPLVGFSREKVAASCFSRAKERRKLLSVVVFRCVSLFVEPVFVSCFVLDGSLSKSTFPH